MTPELEAHLRSFVNFPSPPGVATHVIELAQDPNIEMGKVAKVVAMDPALTSKVLRIANSPLYALRRRSENLRQALVIMGLNATLTLALSFSLVKSLRGDKPNGVNYPYYWRRALLAATASRALGDALGQPYAEERFLAGLLQDIGMLALDRGVVDLYRGVGDIQRQHRALQAYEKRRLGVDHAEVGAWLMRTWNLPDRLCAAIEQSHRIDQTRAREPADIFNRCVALSGSIADIFLNEAAHRPFAETALVAERTLGLLKQDFGSVLNTVSTLIPEVESLFETDILGAREPEIIMEQAREILMVRNLQTLRDIQTLKTTGTTETPRGTETEEELRRDTLTGAYTRSYLDACLAREFTHAVNHDWPLSIALVDLDGLKRINDAHGYDAGDRILQTAARILRGNTRETDIVARYAGEEFALVLPATDQDTARTICERIVSAFQQTRHDFGGPSTVTVSIGYATHWSGMPFGGVESFLNATEQALYTAKLQGRNRSLPYEAGSGSPTMQFL
jgi:diguanylate cyclase (GGDEF)-like protein